MLAAPAAAGVGKGGRKALGNVTYSGITFNGSGEGKIKLRGGESFTLTGSLTDDHTADMTIDGKRQSVAFSQSADGVTVFDDYSWSLEQPLGMCSSFLFTTWNLEPYYSSRFPKRYEA